MQVEARSMNMWIMTLPIKAFIILFAIAGVLFGVSIVIGAKGKQPFTFYFLLTRFRAIHLGTTDHHCVELRLRLFQLSKCFSSSVQSSELLWRGP